MFKRVVILVLFISSIAVISMDSQGKSGGSDYEKKIIPGQWLRNIKVPLPETENQFAAIQIYFPKKFVVSKNQRTLVALHGYNQNSRDMEKNLSLEKYAEEYNFVLVCPDMGQSVYESQFYPETTVKWSPVPGGKYISEILLPFIQDNFTLALKRDYTGVLGFSTGARGALLMASLHNKNFGAAAGISGEYDPLSMQKSRILISIYGDSRQFTDRWANDDNILKLTENLKKTPVFLSHSVKDYITPVEQSRILALALKQLQKKYGGYDVTYQEKKIYAQDWRFWNSVLPEVMEFFDKKLDN